MGGEGRRREAKGGEGSQTEASRGDGRRWEAMKGEGRQREAKGDKGRRMETKGGEERQRETKGGRERAAEGFRLSSASYFDLSGRIVFDLLLSDAVGDVTVSERRNTGERSSTQRLLIYRWFLCASVVPTKNQ